MLDLNDVAIFVQVARSGSFAEAARHLGFPSNTISRRVLQLEAQLGARLLHRTTRRLSLTPAGQSFLDHCVDAIDDLADAGKRVMNAGSEPAGSVRVAAPADFFDFFPMQWVADFLDEHPRVQLDFVLSDAQSDLVASRIDVALRGGQMKDSSYVGRPLLEACSDRFVASPSYLKQRGVPRSLKDLKKHDGVGFGTSGQRVTWRVIDIHGEEQTIHLPSRFIGNTAQSLRAAALCGLGIALLPEPITRLDVEAGRLIPLLPGYGRGSMGLHALYPSRRHLPSAVSAFVDMVAAKLKPDTQPPPSAARSKGKRASTT